MLRRMLGVVMTLAVILGAAVTMCLAALALVGYVRAPGLLAVLERPNGSQVDPATFPPARLCALLAVQDRAFYRHHGLGLFDGPPLHTTLTQSLCKGLYFERYSPGTLRYRKIALMAFAVGFDLRVPKQAQLRVFVNHAYLGNASGVEVLGFPAAARAYFKRDLANLNDQEYLSLVGMLVAPSSYHVTLQPEASARRTREIEAQIEVSCSKRCLELPPYAPCAAVAQCAPWPPNKGMKPTGPSLSERCSLFYSQYRRTLRKGVAGAGWLSNEWRRATQAGAGSCGRV